MNQRDKTTGLKFQFPKFSLKWKLVGLVILVGSIPLVLAMVFSYIQGNKSLENVIGSSFKALAFEASKNIDLIVLEEVSKIHQISRHPTIILSVQEQNRTMDSIPPLGFDTFLREQSKLWKDGDDLFNSLVKRVASRVLISFNSQDVNRSKITKAVFVTDARGILVASINHHPSYENAYRPSWKSIIKSGKKIYIGDLFFNSKTQSYLLEIALPILDRNKKPIGVFHRLYSAKDFFSPFIEPIQFGKTGRIMLIDSKGLVLDCPILPTGHQLLDPNLIENTTGPTASWVKTLGNGHGGKEASIIGFSPLKEVSKITHSSTGKRWYTFAWKSSGGSICSYKQTVLVDGYSGINVHSPDRYYWFSSGPKIHSTHSATAKGGCFDRPGGAGSAFEYQNRRRVGDPGQRNQWHANFDSKRIRGTRTKG